MCIFTVDTVCSKKTIIFCVKNVVLLLTDSIYMKFIEKLYTLKCKKYDFKRGYVRSRPMFASKN